MRDKEIHFGNGVKANWTTGDSCMKGEFGNGKLYYTERVSARTLL